MPLPYIAGLTILLTAVAGAAENEPIVRILVPGFTVQELPVHLSNVNNLRFAPDGRLFALAYDGRIHVLRDTNGDGLEDSDEIYWDKPTLSVPVGMALAPEGVYVSSHGKVSLLRDTHHAGKADVEQVVASDWPPTDVASGGVDAIGVTKDKSGAVYFGLIAADYSNPYRVKDGVSHYELNGKRGTIQKLSRDYKTMETVATGIRVPYALAFNKAGDLFCTDQEGETWCPNGNPLDELNHVIRGRNYGFPPRHEKWLPDLVSEPPVVAFGPQHQSTCGLVFNEPKHGQRLFGPAWWEGDAFIAGESRGKIWRVRLVKTPHGYGGKEFTFARVAMLVTDVTISPKGSLYICCHSGKPDWGTGPKGEGKIFKISYTDPKAPQPVLAWPSDASEVSVTFDKPIDPSVTNSLPGRKIEFGEYVRAGDRYEVLKPPYKVVAQQDATPRGKLNIVAARLRDARTLVLATDPHPQAVAYALTIPGVKAIGEQGPGAVVDVDYEVNGSLNRSDWNDLVRTLPGGHEIERQAERMPWSIGSEKRRPYPYIHDVANESSTGLVLNGGDYERGRGLYFGQQLKCAACHRVRGEGSTLGPDLSNLVSGDAASVLRDIREPSASINPDYVAYNVTLADDSELTGFVRAQTERSLRVVGADGKEQVIPREQVKVLRPSSVSLMPTGLLDPLKEGQVTDLMTFLMNEAPMRSSIELDAIRRLIASDRLEHGGGGEASLNIVLVASKQDHGPAQHDYPHWQQTWHKLLERAPNATVTDGWLWPSAEQFQKADVIVFYYWNRDWTPEKYKQLDDYLERGGGIVSLHSACIGNPDPAALAERIGFSSDSGRTKYLHTPLDLKFAAPASHPIIRGLPATIHFLDEPYWPLIGEGTGTEILAGVEFEGKNQPLMWSFTRGKGRGFVSVLGHYTSTLDDPWFRLIVLRGIGWVAGDVSRFEGLVSPE